MEKGGYVYAIGIEGTTLVKIGRTQNVEQRLRALQTGIPYRLKVLKVYPCAEPQAIEQRMHALLKERCHVGEWFDFEVQGLDAVFQDASTVPPLADVVQRLGEALHLARRRRDMTIKDLAVHTGVSPTIILLIETGKRPQVNFALIAKLAKRLPVSLDALVKQDEEDEPEPPLPPRPARKKAAKPSQQAV